jgi:hypothetical protein
MYKIAYRIGWEVGFALHSIARLVDFVMFPFPHRY